MATLAPDCQWAPCRPSESFTGSPWSPTTRYDRTRAISYNAGSHRYSVRVDRPRREQACGAYYADLAVQDDAPAWAGS